MELLMALLLIFSDSQSLVKDLRKHYALVGANETHVDELLNLSKNSEDPTIQAYAAGAEMASAQYKFSPLSKLSAFKSGKAKLEKLVEANRQNPEIRFIRYTIQLKCPSMLGYNKELKTDRAFLLGEMQGLRKNNPELYKYILSFMLLHDKLSESERESLNLK
jgi:hypothetical protein